MQGNCGDFTKLRVVTHCLIFVFLILGNYYFNMIESLKKSTK